MHCRFQHEVISVLPYSSRAFKCTMGAPRFFRFQRDKPNKQTTFFSRYQGKDILFRFILEYSSLRDFGPWVICLFLYEDFWKIIFQHLTLLVPKIEHDKFFNSLCHTMHHTCIQWYTSKNKCKGISLPCTIKHCAFAI